MRLLVATLTLALGIVGGWPATNHAVLLTTLNCYWFFGDEDSPHADKPPTKDQYSLKAGHLVGLLPREAPLFIGLQEIGNGDDVRALLDVSTGWGVHGRPARVSDLERELSKHLVVWLTNAVTSMDVCVVHLRVPRDAEAAAKQRDQNRALLRWSMRHLAGKPKANVVILGDFNEGKPPGRPDQSLAVLFDARPPMVDAFDRLTGRLATHHDGRAYDRVIVSDAIAKGLAGLRLEDVIIGRHRRGGREDRVMYTDHFPVTVRLGVLR